MSNKTVIAIILVILALAVFFRFYLITEIPPGLFPDEAANGNNALEALRTAPPAGGFKIFYPENNGREGLFINLQAIAIKFLGAKPWVLRLVSAVFGTLTVLGIYLLTRELFRKPEADGWKLEAKLVAPLASFFLATSFWHINFSRIGFRAVMVPFFAVFAMYWLLKALRTEKISSTILAGVFTGLGFYTYIAFRFMPFVFALPILAALASWWRGKQAQRCVPCVVALFLFVAFIAALPIGIYFLNHPQDFFGRGGQVSIFSAESPLYAFAKSTALTLGMFNIRGDCNQRHNLACQPELFWPVGILFVVGLLSTIRSAFSGWQKSQITNHKFQTNPNDQNSNLRVSGFGFRVSPLAAYILLAWFLFTMLPATLTREGLPHALRSIGMIPPVMIFAGLGGAWLWSYLTIRVSPARLDFAWAKSGGGFGFRVSVIAAILFLVWIPINTYRGYFIRFAYAPESQSAFAADLWRQGQYLARLPDTMQKFVIVNLSGDDIRGVPAPAQTIMFATDTFDAERRQKKNIHYLRDTAEISIRPEEKTIILPMNSHDRALMNSLKERYPFLKERVLGDFTAFDN